MRSAVARDARPRPRPVTPALAVFLHAPRLGTVKSRLAAEIGERHALRLYRIMAARTLAAAREAGLEVDGLVRAERCRAGDEVLAGRGLRVPPAGLRRSRRPARQPRRAPPIRGGPGSRSWAIVPASTPRFSARPPRSRSAASSRSARRWTAATTSSEARRRSPTSSPRCRGAPSRLLPETRARLAHVGVAWRELPPLRAVDTMEHARAERLLT